MNQRNGSFNGWTNYETWNVKLWLDNDEVGCHDQEKLAREAIAPDFMPIAYIPYDWVNGKESTEYDQSWKVLDIWALRVTFLADALKNYIEESVPDWAERYRGVECFDIPIEASLYADLLRSALEAVNWQEIADAILREPHHIIRQQQKDKR